MTNKYSHYLAQKTYHFAPLPEQKAIFRSVINQSMSKYILHSFASEVVEYVYNEASEQEQREMIYGLYGNYFLLLKEFSTN